MLPLSSYYCFMKKISVVLFLCLCVCTSYLFAQTDTVYFHNGTVQAAKIIKIDAATISYKINNAGNEIEFVAGRYAIEKIVYKNGNTENISEKITVTGESDWQKVIIVEDKALLAGLKRKQTIDGSNTFINLHTPYTGNRKAIKRIKKAAAALGCAFVNIYYDKESSFMPILRGVSGLQYVKEGWCYSY